MTRRRNLVFRDLKQERRKQGAHRDKKAYVRPSRLSIKDIQDDW